ncbi:MdlB ABC transporter ATPase/permease component [Biomphalaria pfeifferi]|uniref:MdlB ABC transporter ATPase/permease component n=1 Tax=Biomphalaria pfeifferi TaxID=112525 RepID=A0AAD8ANS5_BIOPF|nr:MdlB ABC transporter ATPase/permease component [Biomphalaria pfeifferi]KAK0038911.1 MdlB ABC transporter ATPase/permease component [Biomphalaria pfeifferi]
MERYEWPLLKKVLMKIMRMMFTRKTVVFPLFLLPLLLGLDYSNRLQIRATRVFSAILSLGDHGTLGEYVSLHLGAEALRIVTMLIFMLIFTQVYSSALVLTMEEYMSLRQCGYKGHTVGSLSLRYFEKGESASCLVYTIFPYLYLQVSYLVQALGEIQSVEPACVFYILLMSILAHLTVYYISLGKTHSLLADVTTARAQVSSVMTAEALNYEIIKSCNLESSSSDRVRRVVGALSSVAYRHTVFVEGMKMCFQLLEFFTIFIVLLLYKGEYMYENIDATIELTRRIHCSVRTFLVYLSVCDQLLYKCYLFENDIPEHPTGEETICEVRALCVRNLSFMDLFRNLNFDLYLGESVAVLGKPGSGKSVLMKILVGLLPYGGSVTVDGVELRSIVPTVLRSAVTVVLQTDRHIKGSVMKTLQYGNMLADDQVMEICKKWGMQDIINHSLSSNLVELSEGQRQKVLFMRAMLRDTQVVMLDDCLGSVDNKDKDSLVDMYLRMKGKILMMVVKSKSLVNRFDKVMIVDGDDSMFGTPSELHRHIESFFDS